MPLYVIDTVSMFRMRYVIEADELSHAMDEVTMSGSGKESDIVNEFSQKHLDELITDGREITAEEFQKMLKDDPDCCHWMGEGLIHKINYER